MQRRIDVTVPAERTDELLAAIDEVTGILGVRVQRGISRRPPGDVISVETLNHAHHEVLKLLSERRIGRSPDDSMSITMYQGYASPSVARALPRERSNVGWEEMSAVIAKNGNMTPSALLLMAVAGAVAALGILTGALHIVIAAMLIAPGFEPIQRIPLGAISRSGRWTAGVRDVAFGYAALAAGSAAAAVLLRLLGYELTPDVGGAYMAAQSLVSYWSSVSGPSLLISAAAGLAGAILIATDRPVLTSGVMVALALVPSAALVAVGVVAGNGDLVGDALVRWLLDVVLVGATGAAVFAWKRASVIRRDALA